jgi:ABC-type antimicrobial peptide transport system permease subunit
MEFQACSRASLPTFGELLDDAESAQKSTTNCNFTSNRRSRRTYAVGYLPPNVVITIIGAMGIMGLGLAIVGLYGLVAYAASRRIKEIGIRMAIGADQFSVLRMVLQQGLALAAGGLAAGLLASLGASRGLAAVFPGLSVGRTLADLAALSLVASAVGSDQVSGGPTKS